MTGGTYTLLVEFDGPATVTVGALGDRRLDAGWYAYVGSALGPGGFARVERHREVAAGERSARHWHVDYLLGHPGARLADVVRSPGCAVECAVARRVGDLVVGSDGGVATRRVEKSEAGRVEGSQAGRTEGSEAGHEKGPEAGRVDGRRIPGFGASDCDCDSHLVYAGREDALAQSVREAHRTA